MTTPQEILGQMIAVADEQTDNIQTSIDQVNDQINEYSNEINGIRKGLCNRISDDTTGELSLYLDSTKVIELAHLDADHVEYGPNYGTIDYTTGGVTDWSIVDTTGNVIYRYEGINWDNDTTIIDYVEDFNFGNDYITRPLTSGATYGLEPNRDALITALGILTANKNKVSASKTTFEDYT